MYICQLRVFEIHARSKRLCVLNTHSTRATGENEASPSICGCVLVVDVTGLQRPNTSGQVLIRRSSTYHIFRHPEASPRDPLSLTATPADLKLLGVVTEVDYGPRF